MLSCIASLPPHRDDLLSESLSLCVFTLIFQAFGLFSSHCLSYIDRFATYGCSQHLLLVKLSESNQWQAMRCSIKPEGQFVPLSELPG